MFLLSTRIIWISFLLDDLEITPRQAMDEYYLCHGIIFVCVEIRALNLEVQAWQRSIYRRTLARGLR